MPQPRNAPRSAEPSPEAAVMAGWLAEEGDYIDLRRPRRTVELEVAVALDVDEPERA
jgi:hypothetical protein